MESKVLKVEGMSCAHCAGTVTKALQAIDGVDRVSVDLAQKEVEVDFDASRVALDRIRIAIVQNGYDVV